MTEPLHLPDPLRGLSYNVRPPKVKQDFAVLMLHGLGGDESSMSVLEQALPQDSLLVSPRGLYGLGEGSFSWVNPRVTGWATIEDFQTSVEALEALIEELQSTEDLDPQRLVLMGFSLGAGLAFAYAATSKIPVKALIVAAAFLPMGDIENLRGIPVFWGHGKLDEWIPISRALYGVEKLREQEAEVHFCEANVGHKLGVECLEGLKAWTREIFPASAK